MPHYLQKYMLMEMFSLYADTLMVIHLRYLDCWLVIKHLFSPKNLELFDSYGTIFFKKENKTKQNNREREKDKTELNCAGPYLHCFLFFVFFCLFFPPEGA